MHIPTSNAKPNDGYLFGPRQAWFAFAMTISLMLFDYIDRQVIVSLFPYMKADWGLSDKQLGALVWSSRSSLPPARFRCRSLPIA